MQIKREKPERVSQFVILRVPWRETACHTDPLRASTRFGQEAEGERGIMGLCFGFFGKEWGWGMVRFKIGIISAGCESLSLTQRLSIVVSYLALGN